MRSPIPTLLAASTLAGLATSNPLAQGDPRFTGRGGRDDPRNGGGRFGGLSGPDPSFLSGAGSGLSGPDPAFLGGRPDYIGPDDDDFGNGRPRVITGNPPVQEAPHIVYTSSGPVRGGWDKFRPNVQTYLGIPYAKAPVGKLRFQAPVRAGYQSKLMDGSQFGSDCLSHPDQGSGRGSLPNNVVNILESLNQVGKPMSEDCLSINVWTKPSENRNKAVLLWTHGGGFVSGSSSIDMYDGAAFADDEDVIFVSYNYRLGFWGFPGAPGAKDANPGLLDQRMAVEWVRDNIANFGGDPKRITLFGESAGGASVDYHTYAWRKNPIISSIIAESGVASIGSLAKGTSEGNWYELAQKLGCGGEAAGESTVECVRHRDFREIQAATERDPAASTMDIKFSPIADNKTVFSDYGTLGRTGKFAHIPALIGNNAHEAGLMQLMDLGKSNSTDTYDPMFWSIVDAVDFSCPSGRAAGYRTDNKVPSWRYRFFGDFPNQRLFPGIGAYHTSEIFVTFDTAAPVSGVPDTPEQHDLGKYMRHAWASFAKDPKNGLVKLGWPTYDTNTESLIRLGYNNETTASFTLNQQVDDWCALADCVTKTLTNRPQSGMVPFTALTRDVGKFFIKDKTKAAVLNVDQQAGLRKCGVPATAFSPQMSFSVNRMFERRDGMVDFAEM
jgi:carboxylesterase type B